MKVGTISTKAPGTCKKTYISNCMTIKIASCTIEYWWHAILNKAIILTFLLKNLRNSGGAFMNLKL